MPRASVIQNQFTRGELSPRMRGRIDLTQYYQGCRTMQNWLPLSHGGATVRPGLRYVATAKAAGQKARLLPFVFNVSDSYVLELGAGYMRVYRDRGQVLDAGGAPYELATPYAEDELFAIKHVQDADTMWLVHPAHKPKQLTRAGHDDWSLSDYAPTADPFTGPGGYPAAVAFFEQRIVFGYTAGQPQRLWFSRSGNVQDMTTGTGDSDGFTKDIYARQANPIRWIAGGTDLVVGTTGGIWVVDRPASSPVTVSNFTIKRRITAGADDRTPAEVDNRVLYVERRGDGSQRGRELRDMRFDDADSQFIAAHLSLISDHVIEPGVEELAWQEQGWAGRYQGTDLEAIDRVLWLVRSDGVLASFTYDPQEVVSAWARQVTDGDFESVAVIPGADGDEVWCVVRREIAGSPRRHVEFFDPGLFLDAALSGTAAPPQLTWSGLEHLEGESVRILADGSPVGGRTVSGGAVTLDAPAGEVQVGLPFAPEIALMPLELALSDGAGIGAAKSVARVVLRFLNTVGIRVTASARAPGIEIPFRQVADDVAAPIPPFTGDKALPAPTSWADATVKIIQPDPLPATVLAVVLEMEGHR